MSEANKINIDVGDVLKRGSNEVGMAELNKMGLKKVKVIRHSQVQELISQAVENAISRFIFGAEGRKEHERLMSLINEKESALSDVSGEERSELKSEVETLKRQMQDQAQRLEEAKAKVIEETKKEYEALAEKTSLENQLIMQKKTELDLHKQLQDMTMLMGQLKEKARSNENEYSLKSQDLEKLPILEEQLSNLENENESLQKELEQAKDKIEIEKQKNIMAAKAISEKLKQSEEQYSKISKLEAEQITLKDSIRDKEFALKEVQSKADRLQTDKEDIIKNAKSSQSGLDGELKRIVSEKESALQKLSQIENTANSYKEQIITKDFAIREAQAKIDKLQSEKDSVLKNAQSSQSGLDSELKKVFAEKDFALQKVIQLESSANSLKDQVREKDFSIREMQLKVDHLKSEKEQAILHSSQLDSQIAVLKDANHESKLAAEKLSIKEEAAREKYEALKGNLSLVTHEKEKAVASLSEAESEIEKLQNTINELTQQMTEKSNEDKNAAMLEAIKLMMTDMKGDFSEQLGKAKLRGGGGGGGGNNNNDNNYVELDPAVILKNMFAEKVESNFGKVALDSRKTSGKKDFGKTLDALKNLKGDKKEE